MDCVGLPSFALALDRFINCDGTPSYKKGDNSSRWWADNLRHKSVIIKWLLVSSFFFFRFMLHAGVQSQSKKEWSWVIVPLSFCFLSRHEMLIFHLSDSSSWGSRTITLREHCHRLAMTYTIQLSTIGNKGKTKRIKKNPETTSTKEKKKTRLKEYTRTAKKKIHSWTGLKTN